jgi:hypothetical protein
VSRDWWPEDGMWPGGALAAAFVPAGSGQGRIRVLNQELGESQADFEALLAEERAAEHPETLWICVVMECAAEWPGGPRQSGGVCRHHRTQE